MNNKPTKKKYNKSKLSIAFTGINRNDLAKELSKKKTARNWIDQIVAGHCKVSALTAIKLERLTGVSRKLFRPDIFGR